MINNCIFLRNIRVLKERFYFQCVLGVLGQIPATIDNLIHMHRSIPKGAPWSVCAVGLSEWSMITEALLLGGNVRVEFENNIYLSKSIRAKSNAEMVDRAVRIARELDREVASPEDVRNLLKLSPGDKVYRN